jgi:hypothetical protein
MRLWACRRLLSELLDAHESTISLAARRVIPLLDQHGITHDSSTRITTLGELREHAAAAGITLNVTTHRTPGSRPRKTPQPPNTTRPNLL